MKFLVIWHMEISRLSGEMMKSVLRMRDYALPLEEQGKVIGRYHIVGSHGGAWIYNVTSNDELEMLLAQSPVYNYAHFQVYPLADIIGGKRGRNAADMLVAIGIVTALPTAAAGLSDWSDTIGEDRRIGTAHAIGNVAALTLYTLSWRARRRGRRGRGVLLGFMGAGAATVGGYLGGHLVYRKGVGPDRNAWKHGGDEWVELDDESSLVEATEEPRVVKVGDDDVLVVRQGAAYVAISNVCGHAGGPLDEGTFDDNGCVTCPWHGSVFRLRDGHVVHGPATGNQPRYDVRPGRNGKLSVR